MKQMRIMVTLALMGLLASGMALAAKKIEFTGEFTSPGGGFPPGPPPQICAERFGSCGADTNPDIIEACNTIVGSGTEIGVFEGDVFLCIDTATGVFFNGYYENRGANGSTFFGPFQGQNVPIFPGGVPGPEGPIGFVGFGEWSVDGGTGLFEGATSGTNPARVSQPNQSSDAPGDVPAPATIYLEGTIEIENNPD